MELLLKKQKAHLKEVFYPLTLEGDKQIISPDNITPQSHIKIMRVKKMITNKRTSWLLNKFSFSAPLKCIGSSKENMHTDVRI